MIITSWTPAAPKSYRLQFDGGIRGRPREVDESLSASTRVSLAGLFYHNQVKANQVRARVDVCAVRRFLAALALLNPQVRFSLRQIPATTAGPISCLLQTSGSNNIRTVCAEVLGDGAKAGGGGGGVAAALRSLPYRCKNGIQIDGVMSILPHTTRDIQHICVNRRYVVDTWLSLQIEVRKFFNLAGNM